MALGGLRVARTVVTAMVGLVLLSGAMCGGEGVTRPKVATVQMLVTSANPRVGEATIITAIALTSGGIAIPEIECGVTASDPTILGLTRQGGDYRGVGLRAGPTVVTGNCEGVLNTVNITVRPGTVTLTVNRTGNGNGSVFVNPPGNSFDIGTPVVITATALTGSTFTGWGGSCASAALAATCPLTLTSDRTVSASFVLGAPTRIISLSGSLAFGTVTVGQSVSLTFTITNSGNSR